LLAVAQGSEPFGSCAFKKFQVIGIKHNATGIGVFPIHAKGPNKRVHLKEFMM
jgi:hypothetical protein